LRANVRFWCGLKAEFLPVLAQLGTEFVRRAPAPLFHRESIGMIGDRI
jgi:hypothetical protein